MAILGKIRQRSFLLIAFVGIALLAFILTDLLSSKYQNSAQDNSIGAVDGQEISTPLFQQQVDQMERAYRGSQNQMQIVNMVWNRAIRNIILSKQFEEIGLEIGNDELRSILSTNPQFSNDPTFFNEAGFFDEDIFNNWLSDTEKTNPQQYAYVQLQLDNLAYQAMETRYFNYLKAGIGATLEEGEWDYRMENNKRDIEYVQIPYSSIPDSLVEVTEAEIRKYMKDHEKKYEAVASRDIQYVYFEIKPSKVDEDAVRAEFQRLLDNTVATNAENPNQIDSIYGFARTVDVKEFVNLHSDQPYSDKYLFKNQLPADYANSLIGLKVGEVFGPYLDGNTYKLSRLEQRTMLADSVKSSHIIIPYVGAERADVTVTATKVDAKKRIDSLFAIVRNSPGKFAEIANEVNTDGTRGQGGDIGWTRYSQITDQTFDRAFSDFIFFNKQGALDVVETKFGYHIIRVDEKRNETDAIRLATITRKVVPSETTENENFSKATRLLSDVKDGKKSFLELAEVSGYEVRTVEEVKALDDNLPGLPNARSVTRWAFEDKTEVGDVQRFKLSGGYLVAQLTEKKEKGLKNLEEASVDILPILRQRKKAEMIIANNKGKAMDVLATDNNVGSRTATALNLKSPTLSGAGQEGKVVGAAFALNEGENSTLIEGEKGVYMIKVTRIEDAPGLDNYLSYALSIKKQKRSRVNSAAYKALEAAADIEDNRAKIY